MRKVSFILLVIGLAFVGYFGYQYITATQSVTDYNPSNDTHENNTQREENQKDKEDELNKEKSESTNKKKSEDTKEENNDQEQNVVENETDNKTMSEEIDKNKGEEVATLKIPKLNKQFVTYWGTGEDTLGQGVGMYVSEWTVTPNYTGNVVLSGHRDTVFTGLGDLDNGDTLELDFGGKTYEYEIDDTWITDPDDRSVIVDKDKPTLTLTTCYPFDYIGDAPERYIVQARQK